MASIVVVGGGVAGLTCAWHLQRAGHDVEVLERETEAGGRMRSEPRDGFVLDRGAAVFYSGYRNLHGVALALGIDGRVRALPRGRGVVLRDGELHPGDAGSPRRLLFSPLLTPRAKLQLARLPLEILRRRRSLDPLRPDLAGDLDRESMAAGLRRLGGEEAFEYLLAPAFSSSFQADAEDLSLAFALLGWRLQGRVPRPQSFAGGSGLLTRTLAQQVPVRPGCEVVAVETEANGACVRYRRSGRQNNVYADAAVVAVPGSLVSQVCPKLTPAERAFFEAVEYTRGAIVYLLFERAPRALASCGTVAFPRREGLDLSGLALDHEKPGFAPPGAGLVRAALTAKAAERVWDAPDEEIAALVLENLARTPVGRLVPLASVVHRWFPMLPRFAPGQLRRLAAFLRRVDRSPRTAFAGDYLIGPHTEAAVTSGLRAATEVERLL